MKRTPIEQFADDGVKDFGSGHGGRPGKITDR
jgi:hypothetical protein